MIVSLSIVGYIVGALAVGRWIFLDRYRQGLWRREYDREDTKIVVVLGMLFWPGAAALQFVTRSPKPTRQQRVEELEKELGLRE